MLADTRIIARQSATAGGLEVLAARHEIMLRDGMALQMHPVLQHGMPLLTLRAVEIGQRLVLVDLATLCPGLDAELRRAAARDHVGVVFYSLRGQFHTGAAMTAAVVRHATGSWWPVSDGFVWQPAARHIDAEVLDVMAAQAPRRPLAMALQTLMGAAC